MNTRIRLFMDTMTRLFVGETIINPDLDADDIYKAITFFNDDGTENTIEGNFKFQIAFDKNDNRVAEFEDCDKGITISIDERSIGSHKGIIIATDKENYHLYTEIRHVDPNLQRWVKANEDQAYIWLCGEGDASKPKVVKVSKCFNTHMIVNNYLGHPVEESSKYHIYANKQYLYATIDKPDIIIPTKEDY